MLNPNQQLKSLANKPNDENIVFSLLTIAKEFGMNYEEMLEIPIPALTIYIEYLNKLGEEQKKAMRKKR